MVVLSLSLVISLPVTANLSRATLADQSLIQWHSTTVMQMLIALQYFLKGMFSTDREISLYTDMLALGQSSFFRKAEDARLKIGSQYILLYTVGLRFMPLDWVRILTFWCGTGTDKNHLLIFNWNRTVGVHMDAQRSRNHSLGKSGHLHINNEHSLTIKQKENCFQ